MVMRATLLWIESGSCSGESMAILGLDGPFARGDYNLAQFLEDEHVRLLWHPSLSLESPRQLLNIVDSIVSGNQELTLLCVEGSVIHGPKGTGMFDSIHGKPKKDLIAALCSKAEYVLAMGTCAAFGGIPAAPPNPTESSGLQFRLEKPGGLLEPRVAFSNRISCSQSVRLSGRCRNDARDNGLYSKRRPPTWISSIDPPPSNRACQTNRVESAAPEKVGYTCYNCIGARFPISKRLFRHAESGQLRTESRRGARQQGGHHVNRRLIQLDMNRVEGDLQITLEVEGNTITDAWCVGSMYRGYEQVLVGREPTDALVIGPRICGICSTSQLYAATLALEDASQMPVAPNGTRIRNLCLMAEAVMNDARHTFLMFAPDFCNRAVQEPSAL